MAVDAARGVALVAVMAVHVLPSTNPDGTAVLGEALARGRASAAFAVLAGVALSLAHGGSSPLRGRAWGAASAGLAVRCAVIGALGLLLGGLGSGVAVILTYYAVLFALAAPLLAVRAAVLARIAVGCGLLAPVLSQLLRPGLPLKNGPSPNWTDLDDPVTLLTELTVTGYYPVLVWTTYLCAGLAVGRLQLSSRRVAAGVLATGAVLAVGSVAASRWLVARGVDAGGLPADAEIAAFSGTVPADSWWWLVVDSPHSGTPLDLAHTTGTALALLGVLLVLGQLSRRLLAPLAWVGSMTLTLYSAHVVALANGYGPDDPEQIYGLHVAAAFVLAAAWRSEHERGPLEHAVSQASRGTARVVARGGVG